MFSHRFKELSEATLEAIFTDSQGILTEGDALKSFFRWMTEVQRKNGIVYVIGNGGSAGIASHFSTDLIKSLQIPSQTLYDSNLMTCLSNDYGYEHVFSYPLEKVLRPSDLLVAISSSGKSPNILKAAQAAIDRKVPLITLSGFLESNPLRALGTLNLWVNRCDYGLVEMAHFFFLHTVIDLWNKSHPKVKDYVQSLESLLAK